MRKRRIHNNLFYASLFAAMTIAFEAVSQQETEAQEEPVGLILRPSKWTFEEHYRKELGLGSMEDLNRIALEYDVDFIAWSGDFAYADGRADMLYRWKWWFQSNMNSLIAEDGRVVPLLLGVGNHETVKGFYSRSDDFEQTDEWRQRNAPYFLRLVRLSGASPALRSLILVTISAWSPLIQIIPIQLMGSRQNDWRKLSPTERKSRTFFPITMYLLIPPIAAPRSGFKFRSVK